MKNLIETLQRIDKIYYTIADLRKITRLSTNSLYVVLSRLVRRKSLIRLTSGVFMVSDKYNQIDVAANMLYQPSYLSFESALSRYGILSQVPYALTFATTKKTLSKKMDGVAVEYRMLKKSLFFGFERSGLLFIATPEKALLDTLYFASFGKLIVKIDQFDVKEINSTKMKKLMAAYPERTQTMVYELLTL